MTNYNLKYKCSCGTTTYNLNTRKRHEGKGHEMKPMEMKEEELANQAIKYLNK